MSRQKRSAKQLESAVIKGVWAAQQKDSGGHDAFHSERVARLAQRLAKGSAADRQVVSLAAWLHDLADWKQRGGDDTAAGREAEALLRRLGASQELAARVAEVISQVSYKGAGVQTKPESLEAKLVQDADRLDALGAIGIARTFAYGGAKGRVMYDPKVPPVLHKSFAQYKRAKGHTINHFYEKLLLLKARMNTPQGRALARQRHQVLLRFLRDFKKEWAGR